MYNHDSRRERRRDTFAARHEHGRPCGHAERRRHPHDGPRGEHRGFGRGRRGWGRRGAGRGDVRAAALMLLADQPMHGYEIIQQIGERSGGAWRPSPGSVYPALQMLEDQGLIEAEAANGRRVFHLTETGRDHVAQRHEELTAAWDAVKGAAGDVSTELRDLVDQVGMAAGQVARVGAPAQMAAARDLLTATRQQLYRILAEDAAEPDDAPQ